MANKPIIAGTRKITGAYYGNLFYSGGYHGDTNFVFGKTATSVFSISVDDYGGVVTYKNNPIGIVGVPSSVTGDDSIRIISLFNMDYNNPDTGTTSDTLTMRCPDESFLPYKNNLFTGPYDNNNNKITSYTGSFVDGWHDHNVLIQLSNASAGNWRTSDTLPNLNNRNRGYSTAALCAWRYNPAKEVIDMTGYWYLPSHHELIEEANHLSMIDAGALYVKNTYNIGIGRIPYNTGIYNSNKSYYESRFIGSQTSYGGNQGKYNVYAKYNRSQYYATAADEGMAQAWCKLIKNKGKWILDPTYHID